MRASHHALLVVLAAGVLLRCARADPPAAGRLASPPPAQNRGQVGRRTVGAGRAGQGGPGQPGWARTARRRPRPCALTALHIATQKPAEARWASAAIKSNSSLLHPARRAGRPPHTRKPPTVHPGRRPCPGPRHWQRERAAPGCCGNTNRRRCGSASRHSSRGCQSRSHNRTCSISMRRCPQTAQQQQQKQQSCHRRPARPCRCGAQPTACRCRRFTMQLATHPFPCPHLPAAAAMLPAAAAAAWVPRPL